ncbi:hypothetical protein [Actinomadura roseirufa]|uniref:hypothetical protein n=1 Tax=Actinomadura roseirufa TaxID=2094049 RepID=UPI001041BBF9|nr:hypothetical protein [Actinomadura roseirufa]
MTAPARAPADLAESIAAVVLARPDVAALTAGPRGRIMTYRAGLPLAGVAIRPGRVEIGVVARGGRPLAETADDVRRAAGPLAGDRAVDVLIGDVDWEGSG